MGLGAAGEGRAMSDERWADIVEEIADPQWWYYAAFIQYVLRSSAIRITAAPTIAQPAKQTHIATTNGIVIVTSLGNTTTITIQPFGDTRPEWEDIVRKIRRFTDEARGIRRAGEPTADEVIERYYRIRKAGGKTNLRKLADETGFSYSYLRDVKVAYDQRGGWGSKKNTQDTPDK